MNSTILLLNFLKHLKIPSIGGIQMFKDTRWDDFQGRISYGTIKAILQVGHP